MAEPIRVEIRNIDQIRATFRRSPALMMKNLNVAIRKSIMLLRSRSVTNAPVDTTRLRSSAYTTFSPLRGEIGFNANYAMAVHEGTKPHKISWQGMQNLEDWARRKGLGPRTLGGSSTPASSAAAAYAIAWSIRKKGTKANPFLKKAVDESQGNIDRFFNEAVETTLNEIAQGGR